MYTYLILVIFFLVETGVNQVKHTNGSPSVTYRSGGESCVFFPSTEDEGPSCQAFTPRTEVAAENENVLGKGEEESLQILPEIITRDKRASPYSGEQKLPHIVLYGVLPSISFPPVLERAYCPCPTQSCEVGGCH